ncbi:MULTISPECIES: hypothetical protein [unclassified Kitasatospora]|uniref:hypothetical protein n=1 Tax=unclassified Kitasatospora TaxID=2633591 RepID=UPI00070C444F|nr:MULTISPECIES: hypothetical protein [unclassified Kitasatospora]KQV11866.1 hypothetical protein ASC99_35905 [Kitasatospora sp. Root107]KRB68904.1 hypothetical protein ASE03_28830 [Kitasatospora sp. Root187]
MALLAYLPGYQASHSGGLVEVERWFDHPVPLLGAAVVLTVVSMVVEFEFRTKWSQIGCAAAVVALGFIGLPIVFLSFALDGEGVAVDRKAGPNHPDHVLTVTNVAFSIDPVYRVELLTGSGWSARHWDLGVWEERDERGYFKSAEWSGPNQITVTAEKEITVFTVDPVSGRPSEPRAGHR